MNRTAILVGAIIIALFTQGLSAQATLTVPAMYPTIQAAIDAAVEGDTVLVSPGTYFENLVISGKHITLTSTGGAAATIVDGGGCCSCLKIEPGLDRNLVIEKFTFENGKGQPSMMVLGSGNAGGIDIRSSSPTIRFCTVRNCIGGEATAGEIGGAGGIQVRGDCPCLQGPFIHNCRIETSLGGAPAMSPTGGMSWGNGAAGGFQSIESNFYMRACIVVNNVGGDSAGGMNFCGSSAGGIGILLSHGVPLIEDCEIHFNDAGHAQAGAYWAGSGGIGGCMPHILWCNVGGNKGGTAFYPGQVAGAGGIGSEMPLIEIAHVRDNIGGDAHPQALRVGTGGISTETDSIILNAIVGNNIGGSILGTMPGTDGVGVDGVGGVAFFSGVNEMLNCSIANNIGGTTGGLWAVGMVDVKNTIIWDNNVGIFPPTLADQVSGPGSLTITYSDVMGGFPGAGNINLDPLFIDPTNGDFHIAAGSPCIDAGLNGLPLQTPTDCDAEPRHAGAFVDMGADENAAGLMPGSLEDLSLESEVNGNGDPDMGSKCVTMGDMVELRLFSPTACHLPTDMALVATAFPNGSPPPATPGFPNFHLNPAALIVLAPGPLTPFETPYGCGVRYTVPQYVSYPGWTVRIQGLAFDVNAANGFFAFSPAHELCFM